MQVTKIIEGGIDLTTGTELEVGIMVSNGVRELMIPIDEPTLQILSVMVAEANLVSRPTPLKGQGQAPLPEELDKTKEESGCTCGYEDSEEMTAHNPLCVLSKPPSALKPRLVDETSPVPPETPVDEDEGFEPGEEYDDVGTGVSSL